MGNSAKRKKEKQKDFQKPKLKVGKAKAKPDNFTDTSFKSKSITLTQQSLTLAPPTTTTQFTHHVSLLTSKSDSQRRDSLAHLTTAITSRPVDSPLPTPVSVLLPSLLPLILDSNSGVRTNLLKLLRALPEHDIQDHVAQLMPYLRAGMTHLAPDIRFSSIGILDWLVGVAGGEVVSVAGGWIKTMNCFLSVLGWHTPESARWSGSRAEFGKVGKGGSKGVVGVLGVFGRFLEVGFGIDSSSSTEGEGGCEGDGEGEEGVFPICGNHSIPRSAQPYIYLNLFGAPRDEESEMYETTEDRYRVFVERFLPAVRRGVEAARQEGGELGRASAGVRKAVKEAVLAAEEREGL